MFLQSGLSQMLGMQEVVEGSDLETNPPQTTETDAEWVSRYTLLPLRFKLYFSNIFSKLYFELFSYYAYVYRLCKQVVHVAKFPSYFEIHLLCLRS